MEKMKRCKGRFLRSHEVVECGEGDLKRSYGEKEKNILEDLYSRM